MNPMEHIKWAASGHCAGRYFDSKEGEWHMLRPSLQFVSATFHQTLPDGNMTPLHYPLLACLL